MNQLDPKMLNHYLEQIELRLQRARIQSRTNIRRGNATRRAILRFYQSAGRWPKNITTSPREHRLARAMDNLCSRASAQFDMQFYALALAHGRVAHRKTKHDPAKRKEAVLDFIRENGRTPRPTRDGGSQREANLLGKLQYYVYKKSDKAFLAEVQALDKCHGTGIARTYRPIINASLIVDEPLAKMTKKELSLK